MDRGGGGWTYAFEVAPGDTARQAFDAVLRDEAGESVWYEADMTAVCEREDGGLPTLTLTVVAEGIVEWRLVGETSSGCGFGDGTWVRLDGGKVVSGGTYVVSVAVP
ncbi:MAG: hypothetical protein AAF845_07950 [Bacteroidota bacterium]